MEGSSSRGREQMNGGRLTAWDRFVIAVADVPWGVLLALLAVGFILFGGADGLDKAVPMLTAAGLFGIGHGVHTAAKIWGR